MLSRREGCPGVRGVSGGGGFVWSRRPGRSVSPPSGMWSGVSVARGRLLVWFVAVGGMRCWLVFVVQTCALPVFVFGLGSLGLSVAALGRLGLAVSRVGVLGGVGLLGFAGAGDAFQAGRLPRR